MESVEGSDTEPGQITVSGLEYSLGTSRFQVSVEAQCLNHARYLHDMLVPFTPILIALSASSPFAKDQITDHDHGWDAFEKSTDARSEQEKDSASPSFKAKARFSAASRYISNHTYVKDFHNDILEQNLQQCGNSLMLLDAAELDDERFLAYVASLLAFNPL